MKMVLCFKNHYYDSDATPECPFCKSNDDGKTVAQIKPSPPSVSGDDGLTVSVFRRQAAEKGEAVTVEPVTAWLVCISGANKGQEYRICDGNNYIGRGENMDIRILGDETVSRENHAIVTYDSRGRLYYLANGTGRSIIRLNGDPVLAPTQIKARDRIEIGESIFMFVPFCGEDFNWE